MCWGTFIPLIVACLTLAIVSIGTAEGQSCPQITDPQPLNTNAETDGGVDRSPQVTTDGQGLWIAVWYSGDDLGGTIGFDRDILVARSTDNGATWSDPAPLNTNAASDVGDDKEPQLTVDAGGNWLAVWRSDDDLKGTIGSDRDILFSRSMDNGVTWTDPAPLNTNAARDSGSDRSPQLTTDGAGNWVAAWWSLDDLGGTIGTDSDIVFALSADNGTTWTDPAPLNADAGSDSEWHWDRFPQVATDGGGTWVAVWSSGVLSSPPLDQGGDPTGPDGDIFFALSIDNGSTWTDPAPLNTNAASDSGEDGGPQVTIDGQGQWVAVWASTDDLGGTIGPDPDILFSLSTDKGQSWTDPAPLNTNAASDFSADNDASPQLTTDGSGNWVAVWTLTLFFDDPDIMFSLSTSNGVSWSAPALLNTNADPDSMLDYDQHPQVTTDGAGNWVAVWDFQDFRGGPTGADADILVARFQLRPGDCQCPADLNGDGAVNAADLAQLLGAWGPNPGHPADLNSDGIVDAFDLAILLNSWGQCP